MFQLHCKLRERLDAAVWEEISGILYQFHCEGIEEGEEPPPEGEAALLAGDEFEEAIAPGAMLPPHEFKAYFQNRRDAENALRALQPYLTDKLEHGEISVLEEEDYTATWRAGFKPVYVTTEAGLGWVIRASWHTPLEVEAATGGTKVRELVIDPGMAFGTGSHETTRACLAFLSKALGKSKEAKSQHWLDFGCGSGILAIAAKKLGAGTVVGLDIDPLSIEATITNAGVNGVEIVASKSEARATSHINAKSGSVLYDGIVANILRDTLIEYAPSFASWLKPGGLLILSGLLDEQALAVEKTYSANGFSVLEKRVDVDASGPHYHWATIFLAKKAQA